MTPISIYVQRFTGHVYECGVLNDWPIQKIDLLTSHGEVFATMPNAQTMRSQHVKV